MKSRIPQARDPTFCKTTEKKHTLIRDTGIPSY